MVTVSLKNKTVSFPDLDSESFNNNKLVLDPRTFASTPLWVDLRQCIWKGPPNLLDVQALSSVPEYRNNDAITRLFVDILGRSRRSVARLYRSTSKSQSIRTRLYSAQEGFEHI